MMKKKILICLMIFLTISLFLYGCGKKENDTPQNNTEPQSNPVEPQKDYEETKDGSFGGIYVKAEEGDTYKGIVYFDPSNLQRICTQEEALNNLNENKTPTEVISGPMRWYIYDDEGDTYKMILDHNTTACVRWDFEGKAVPLEDTSIQKALDELTAVYAWKVEPRLITPEEISKITDHLDWWYGDQFTGYYYFEAYQDWSAKWESKYDWLYNYTYECISDFNNEFYFGGTAEDKNYYPLYDGEKNNDNMISDVSGYWTSELYGSEDSSSGKAWYVGDEGSLKTDTTLYPGYGVRPVVELDKAFVNPDGN